MPRRFKIMTVVLPIILFLPLASLWGFYTSIRPPKIVSTITPADLGLDFEHVSFKTADGITLAGWFIPSQTERAKTIILLHGYPADKGDILPALSFLSKNYNLFLFDSRSLGQSEGSYSTAGAKETIDLLAAIAYLQSRGIDGIGVWGFSMGGAVALMVAPQTPEIRAIVSESSYARLDLMASELYRIPILKYPLGWLTELWAKIFLNINTRDISPMASAQKLTIPILLIHSKNDNVIPFKNALLLQDALNNNDRAEFWFEDGLSHGQLGQQYRQKIEDFFKRNL